MTEREERPLNWGAMFDALGYAEALNADLPPALLAKVDGAQAQWRERLRKLGLDVRDERDVFAFVCGLIEYARYVENVTLAIAKEKHNRGESFNLEQLVRHGLGSLLSTFAPYLSPHVPPGVFGAHLEEDT